MISCTCTDLKCFVLAVLLVFTTFERLCLQEIGSYKYMKSHEGVRTPNLLPEHIRDGFRHRLAVIIPLWHPATRGIKVVDLHRSKHAFVRHRLSCC